MSESKKCERRKKAIPTRFTKVNVIINVFKNISVLLSKNMFFLIKKKVKETMSREESNFYMINFIEPRIIFLKRKF